MIEAYFDGLSKKELINAGIEFRIQKVERQIPDMKLKTKKIFYFLVLFSLAMAITDWVIYILMD